MSTNIITRNQLTFVTTDETEMTPGNVAFDEAANRYIKCKAAGNIANNQLVKGNAIGGTTHGGFVVPSVVKTVGTTPDDSTKVIGVNNTGQQVDASNFFWCKQGPIVILLGGTTTAVTAALPIYSSATAGEADIVPPASTLPDSPIGLAITNTTGAATTFTAIMYRA